MAMNTMSPNYCRSKGEQIALNVDGTAYEETNTYSAYVYLISTHTARTLFVCYCPRELVIIHRQCLKAKV